MSQNFRKLFPNFLTNFRFVISLAVIVFLILGFKYNDNEFYPINVSSIFKTSVTKFDFVAGCLFIFAAFTDWLDGYLARKWKVISKYGQIMDPWADKLLINGSLIILFVAHKIFIGLVIIIFLRDALVSYMRYKLKKINIVVPAIKTAKLKTATQMIAIIVVLFIFNNVNRFEWKSDYLIKLLIQNFLLFFSSLFAIFSGWQYFLIYHRNIKINKIF